eukprot:jgi/Undpi1/2442/HiC_scaffold_13.g05823.m1
MEQQRRETNVLDVADHEAEASLLRRLDALERLVFGRSAPAEVEVQPLVPKVEAISKAVTRAEGGRREFEELATQASHLGLLSPMPSTSSPTLDDNVALKESILLAARGEIEATASVLAKVKALDKHINPPYLRDISQLSARLDQLDRTYTAQATEAARINERAENARLHYSQAMSLVSEKFVHWDDQVAELERQHASRP